MGGKKRKEGKRENWGPFISIQIEREKLMDSLSINTHPLQAFKVDF